MSGIQQRTIDRIGMIGKNNFGTDMKIIKVLEDNRIIIQFQDEHKCKQNIHYGNFQSGKVKNPYEKTICNVGYVGDGKYKTTEPSGKLTRIYVTWHDLIIRCYDKDKRHLHPSYDDCTVCTEWHNFQNFAKWYEKNYYDIGKGRMHLDKDILVKGNRIYSPDTCVFIPQRINMIFMGKTNRYNLPSGISKTETGRYGTMYNTIHLGTYDTLEEALIPYNKAKVEHIHNVAEEYKKVLPPKLYKVLKNYK